MPIGIVSNEPSVTNQILRSSNGIIFHSSKAFETAESIMQLQTY